MQSIMDELKEYLAEDIEREESKRSLSQEKRDDLFGKLKNAVENERPQLCEPPIESLERYALDLQDSHILSRVKEALDMYDFDEALEALEELK